MGAATVTQKKWGYSITGGTDATVVDTANVSIVRAVCTATASADTCLLTDSSGTTLVNLVAPVTLVNNEEIGARTEGLKVTLSATGSVCNIFA